jgi:hypothetical protein
MFAGKGADYPSEAPFRFFILVFPTGLTHKHLSMLEKSFIKLASGEFLETLVMDKHSNLLC